MPGRMMADWTLEDYEKAARLYCATRPLEHFMEAIPVGRQREITLASLAVVKLRRPEVQVANELLVQYPGNAHLGQVVPDNMIILREEPLTDGGSYNLPFEPAPPFMMLEYVSPSNPRKDYEGSFRKYERELKVPYYLLFYPEQQDLRLYRHTEFAYEHVEPNVAGRLEVPELELEVGLLDGWLRYWFRGELIPLPADLQRRIDALQEQVLELVRHAQQAERRADRQKKRVAQEKQRAEQEKQRAEAAEAEVARLRAQLARTQGKKPAGRPRRKS